jgi:two-component system, chemotaxis family, chemotaxis protein CheY
MAQKLIMVIDDSTSLRHLVSITLQEAGYEVIEAADGQDALSKLDSRRVHLMVCDVNMPVMDGISFVKHVKQSPQHRFVPIIMLTNESGENRKLEGQMAGAKAWLVKPFRPEQVLQAVAKLILP